MNWPPWPKGTEKTLASYVLPDTAGRLRLTVGRDDLLTHGQRKELLEAIYAALLQRDIRYAREPFDYRVEQQRIRAPEVILRGAGDGTCLDLALLFAGLCMGNELLPLVVVLDGHAFVAVSLVRGRRDADNYGRCDEDNDGPWAAEGLLKSGETLRKLVERGDYLPIECTGFARSEAIPATVPEGKGRAGGHLTFTRALEAGREQLDFARAFAFAIDVAMLQDVLRNPAYDPGSQFLTIPAQAPAIRRGFVPRHELLNALRERLAPGGALKVVALHGMAGSGKSVMAAAAAADAEIQARFPDGVLWASLGLAPDLTSILAGWIQAFGGAELRFTAPGPARQHLQTLLAPLSVLIIIDDVWEPAHATALLAGGSSCAVLVTTREATVARACGVAPEDTLPITSMTETQASSLLAGGEGQSLPDAVRAVADEVAGAVGRLPLALQLAAAQAADGVPWEEIRDDLHAEMARLETLDLPGADELADPQLAKQQSLLASLALSVRRLPPDRRRQLAWLGVAERSAVLQPAAAAVFWQMDVRAARDGLRYLHGRALADAWGGAGYKLHDTVHALARRLITAPVEPPPEDHLGLSGLGTTLGAAHAELIDRYAATRLQGQWHSLGDDGYIHRHLAWHLERSERAEELHALLAETTDEGANAWFTVREKLGQPEGFLGDVRRALALAAGPRRTRYALLLASLQSLATNVSPALAQALVRGERWSIPYAAAYAANISDPGARALTFAAVAELADDSVRRELLHKAEAAAAEIGEDADEVVSTLAPRLAASGLAGEALSLARRLGGQPLASVLAGIAAALPASERAAIVSEAAQAAAASGPLFRSGAVASVAPYLDEAQVRDLLSNCAGIPGQAMRETAVANLLPRLAEIGPSDEALTRARSLSGSLERATSLAAIAAVISEPARTQAVREVLSLLPEINDREWAEKMANEDPELPPGARALFVFSVVQTSALAEILASLPPDLPPELRKQAMEVIEGREDPLEAARAVSALAPRLTDEERETAVRRAAERARAELEPGPRVPALAALVDAFPADERAAIAREALETSADQIVIDMDDALRKVGPYLNEEDQVRALALVAGKDSDSKRSQLSVLAPFLLPSLLPRAIAIARSIDDEEAALLAGAALAPELDADDLAALLDWIPRVENHYVRARAVAAVLPHLPEHLLPAARSVIGDITYGTALAEVALPALAARLAGTEKEAALERAVAVASAMDDSERLVWAFQAFVPQLSGAQLTAAVEALDATLASRPESSTCRVQLLATAAAQAGATLRSPLVARALALVSQLGDDEERARALCALAHVLADDERSEAETLANGIANAFERATVYAAFAASAVTPADAHDMAILAMLQAEHFVESGTLSIDQQANIIGARALPYVAPRAFVAALTMITSFEDRGLSAQALADIAPRLTPELLPRAIEIAAGYPAPDRAVPLAALAATATTVPRATLLGQALDAALEADTDLLHDDTLAPLARRLAELPLPELAPLWQRALDALSDRPRSSALASLRALAPVLLRVDGQHGARECVRALRDLRKWWP